MKLSDARECFRSFCFQLPRHPDICWIIHTVSLHAVDYTQRHPFGWVRRHDCISLRARHINFMLRQRRLFLLRARMPWGVGQRHREDCGRRRVGSLLCQHPTRRESVPWAPACLQPFTRLALHALSSVCVQRVNTAAPLRACALQWHVCVQSITRPAAPGTPDKTQPTTPTVLDSWWTAPSKLLCPRRFRATRTRCVDPGNPDSLCGSRKRKGETAQRVVRIARS